MAVAALAAAVVLSATAGNDIVVTRDSGALPSGCTPREAAELLVRFADAVSTGDMPALDLLFAVEDPPGRALEPAGTVFRWYSVSEGRNGNRPWRHTAVYDRADLFAYFAERHRHGESWQVVGLDVAPAGWIAGAAGVTYVIRRDADDLPPPLTRFAIGKGSIDCAAQRIFVWSMGQDVAESRPPCPLPADWSPGVPIVACSRGEAPTEPSGPTARAALPDFRIVGSSARFPKPCAPQVVATRLRSALAAFNAGRGATFAIRFTPRGEFHPYTASPGTQKIGRTAIARFAAARYAAGDGFTAAVVRAPTRRPVRRPAVYAVELVLTARDSTLRAGLAKVVVDCRSGLIRRWVGPATPLPASP
jgi:hypothetical protein